MSKKQTAIIHLCCTVCGAEHSQRTEQIDENLEPHQYIAEGLCREHAREAAQEQGEQQ